MIRKAVFDVTAYPLFVEALAAWEQHWEVVMNKVSVFTLSAGLALASAGAYAAPFI